MPNRGGAVLLVDLCSEGMHFPSESEVVPLKGIQELYLDAPRCPIRFTNSMN
jgi:hypothetical protein